MIEFILRVCFLFFFFHLSQLFQLPHQWEQRLKVGHIQKVGS